MLLHPLAPLYPLGLPTPTNTQEKFVAIIAQLRRVVAWRSGQGGVDAAFMFWLITRLGRTAARFAALVAKIQSGSLRPPRIRASRPPRAARETSIMRLSGARGWLVKVGTYHAAGCAGQLHALLTNDPEMHALIAADPRRMGRLLRPLCRALGVDLPEALRLPPRPRKSTATPRTALTPPEARPEARTTRSSDRPPFAQPRTQRASRTRPSADPLGCAPTAVSRQNHA